jgi:hypothetical protein
MRKYNTRVCDDLGETEVDLDDPKTYSHLPQDIKELWKLMLSEIGYAYCYMNFLEKDIFPKGNAQKKRVKKLIKSFLDGRNKNRDNVLWYQEQVFLFQDETENMC